jgi:hypothetical protein
MGRPFKFLISVLISKAYLSLALDRLGGVLEQFGGSHAWVVDFNQMI